MKTLICISTFFLAFVIMGASIAEGQEDEGYTFFSNQFGSQICIGRWIPSKDVALPGVCEGQVMALSQLTALSARQTVDRLDKLLLSLDAIDQKLSVSNGQMNSLVEVTANTQAMIDQYSRLVSEFLREAIIQRFDELPKEILENNLFRQELEKLKTDILKEIEKHYSKLPAPPKK
jgi:hypothetical protein